jgi:hypothetical protein
MVWSRIIPSAVFGNLISGVALGREIWGSPIEVGFRGSSAAGLRKKLRRRSKVSCEAKPAEFVSRNERPRSVETEVELIGFSR